MLFRSVIFHFKGEQAREFGEEEQGENFFDQAAEYWKRAILLAPNNYIEAQNWLKTTGRSTMDIYF